MSHDLLLWCPSALLYLVCTYFTSMYGSYLAAVFVGILTARLGFIMHTGEPLYPLFRPLLTLCLVCLLAGNHRGTSKSQW